MTHRNMRRRLLFMLPFPPRLDAANGGSRVIAQFLIALSERHEVGMVYLRAPDEDAADATLLARCSLFEEVARPMVVRSWQRRVHLALCLLRGIPMWVRDWNVPRYAEVTADIVDRWQPDVINAEFHVMAQYFSRLGAQTVPRVLTHHEPGIVAAAGLLQAQSGPARVLYWADLLAWRRYEKTILQQMDAVVVFTEEDRIMLRSLQCNTPVACIPRGALVPRRGCDPLGANPPSLLFVGNFAHFPNVDGAHRLAKHVFPRIRALRSDVYLYIVGPQPPESLLALQDERIVVTGRVPDVNPYLERATVVVAPLRLGGGMRVKIVEALAAGKAIVASPLATAGLPLQHNRELLVADNEADFAALVLALLDDPERRLALAKRARAWASQHLDWQRVLDDYEQLYDGLLGARDGGEFRTMEVRADELYHS